MTVINIYVKILYHKIEAHLTKIIAPRKPPRLCEKGVGAEADAVAGIRLARRRISVLLSLILADNRRLCEELSFLRRTCAL